MNWEASIHGDIGKLVRDKVGLAATAAYQETGDHFHEHMKDDRFTEEHAREAGYLQRSGEKYTDRNSKEFKRSYVGKKLRKHKHMRPLLLTGRTKRSTETHRVNAVTGVFTGGDEGEASVNYPQARGLNRRSRHSDINMRREFLKITDREKDELGRVFKNAFASNINKGK